MDESEVQIDCRQDVNPNRLLTDESNEPKDKPKIVTLVDPVETNLEFDNDEMKGERTLNPI